VTRHTPFLFSVDVEDPHLAVAGGEKLAPRVPELVQHYLDFLESRQAKATFFVVGEVARRHPEVVRRIAAGGHEVACHSDRHVLLGRQGGTAFREDLIRNIESLEAAGAPRPRGYRAPCFSITSQTQWAYPILAELGFSYSSSVLPALNPIQGWPGFGTSPRLMEDVLEMPVSLHSRLIPVPLGGVYFRVLPMPLLSSAFARRCRRGEPVLLYLHPYDLDDDAPVHPHPGFSRWSPFQLLMRANRRRVMSRLDAVITSGFRFATYRDHAETLRREIDFPA